MNGFIKVITEAAHNNHLLIFVGAGASIGLPDEIGLPSGNQLNIKLKKLFHENDLIENLSLEKASEYLEGRYGRRTLIDKVKSILSEVKEPLQTHKLIAELPAEVIVTTNYDALIEKALEKNNKTYVTITSDSDLVNLSKKDVKVFKIHGCINTQQDDFILSEKDYYEKFLLSSNLYVDVLKSWLSTHTCLFVGYSLSDINLKHIFFDISQKLSIQNIMGKFYSIQRDPIDAEVSIWEKRGFIIIKSNQNDFLNTIIDEIEFNNFRKENLTLVADTIIRVGKLSLSNLTEIEKKSGADEQRFILLSKRKMNYLNIEEGDWVEIKANNKSEYVKVFITTDIFFELIMPLTVRNLFNLNNNKPILNNVSISKAIFSKINSLRISPHDIITLLPVDFDRLKGFEKKSVITIRNLEFDLLGLKEGDSMNLLSVDVPDFIQVVCIYKFTSNPGRALIGVNSTLKDLLDKLDIDYHDLILR